MTLEQFNYYFNKMIEVKPRKIKVLEPQNGEQFLILYLGHNSNREIIAKNLSDELDCSTARIAVLLNRLEKKNIIKKVQASDKRKVIVSLTELGYDIYNRKLLFFKEYIERILTTIGNDELDRFFDTLKKITQIGEEIND